MKRVIAVLLAAAPAAASAQQQGPQSQNKADLPVMAEAQPPQIDVMPGGAVVWDQPMKPSGGKPASAAPAPVARMEERPAEPKAAATSKMADRGGPKSPPPYDPLSGVPNPPLSAKEKRGVAYGREWKGNRDKPARGADGAAVYVFGSTLPTIVCAPLYVCDLVLEAGETVKTINTGDSVRWQIAPAEQGSGEALITHVIIKPTDVGLVTNMVITTDRRAYVIKLLSRAEDWMPTVMFEYPDAGRANWGRYRAQRAAEQEAREAEKEAAASSAPQGPLDFGYSLSGDRPAWRPVKVYTDGAKTFVEFSSEVAHGELPALVTIAEDNSFLGLETAFNGPKMQLVNYRKDGDRLVVDKVLQRAALVKGVGGEQVIVKIERAGRM